MVKNYMTLKEIEGVIVHDVYLKKEVERRAEAFEYVDDVPKMVEYVEGELVISPPLRCDWMMKKVFFPEVECYFLYHHKDEEFPASMQILFAGERVMEMKGDDLAVLAITTINHMIRYIKRSHPEKVLPRICDIV
jgi:hypothetical protein